MAPEKVAKKPDAPRELLGQPLTQGKVTTSCHSKSCPSPVTLSGVSHTTGCLRRLLYLLLGFQIPAVCCKDFVNMWQS